MTSNDIEEVVAMLKIEAHSLAKQEIRIHARRMRIKQRTACLLELLKRRRRSVEDVLTIPTTHRTHVRKKKKETKKKSDYSSFQLRIMKKCGVKL